MSSLSSGHWRCFCEGNAHEARQDAVLDVGYLAVIGSGFAILGRPLARLAFSRTGQGDLWIGALTIAVGAVVATRWLIGEFVCVVHTVIGRGVSR